MFTSNTQWNGCVTICYKGRVLQGCGAHSPIGLEDGLNIVMAHAGEGVDRLFNNSVKIQKDVQTLASQVGDVQRGLALVTKGSEAQSVQRTQAMLEGVRAKIHEMERFLEESAAKQAHQSSDIEARQKNMQRQQLAMGEPPLTAPDLQNMETRTHAKIQDVVQKDADMLARIEALEKKCSCAIQ